ncbi:MAG: hypothetical protein AB7L17_15520 [Ilumatobacteraceae bacterium]
MPTIVVVVAVVLVVLTVALFVFPRKHPEQAAGPHPMGAAGDEGQLAGPGAEAQGVPSPGEIAPAPDPRDDTR